MRCALPGCHDFASHDLLTCTRERCCGLPHEQMLMRLEQCPSEMPDGHLFAVSVFGPNHDHPDPPVQLLLSPRMTVEALVEYFFMVFFGHNPNEEDLFGRPADIPRRWQVTFPFPLFSLSVSSLFFLPLSWCIGACCGAMWCGGV